MNESRSSECEGRASDNPGCELRIERNGYDLTQLGGIVVQCVRNELDDRSAESQIEEREVLGDRPREAEQAEARGSEVSRSNWHDEERQSKRNREPKEVEKCVVRDAGTDQAAFTHGTNLDQTRFPGIRKKRRVYFDGQVVLERLGTVLADPADHREESVSERHLRLVAEELSGLVR